MVGNDSFIYVFGKQTHKKKVVTIHPSVLTQFK